MSKINLAHRNPSAEDEMEAARLGVSVADFGIQEQKKEKLFFLQFGHPGSVEAHGHTRGTGSVTHLPQHTAPLLLIILIPNETQR